MHWSAILVLALTGPTEIQDAVHVAGPATYASYTQAWDAAHDAERPLLVILNPAGDGAINDQELRADSQLQPLLDEYVVAVIDTTTDHGKKVHELFGSAPLPRVVVIDKQQKKQLYQSSNSLSHDQLASVLEKHKTGVFAPPVLQWTAKPANSGCTSCQKRLMY